MIKKVSTFFADFRSIWAGVLMVLAAVAWAGDARYMLKNEADNIAYKVEVGQIGSRIDELEIEKAYEKDPQKVKMMDALININKNKIETLKNQREAD